jgi:hypothetical protein
MKRSRTVFIIAALMCLAGATYAWETAIIGFDVENQKMYTVVQGDYPIHAVVTYTQTNSGGFIQPGGCDYTCPTELWADATLSPVDRSRMTDVPGGQSNTIQAHITYYSGETPMRTDVVEDVLYSNGSAYIYNNGGCNYNPPDTIRINSAYCVTICHGSFTIPIQCEAPGYTVGTLQVYVNNGCDPAETHCDDSFCPKISHWNALTWRKLVLPPCNLRLNLVYCQTEDPGCICIWRTDFRLPVEMRAFNAAAGDARVELNWSTGSESNLQQFIVTRSTMEEGVYHTVHSEPAANSAAGHNYRWADADVENGITYYYQLIVSDAEGSHTYNDGHREVIVHATPHAGDVPDEFGLAQNYPNPFNSRTVFDFTLADAGRTTLKVYDLLGREMATVVNDYMTAGKHHVNWSAAGLPTGVYIYTLSSGTFVQTRKLLYLK